MTRWLLPLLWLAAGCGPSDSEAICERLTDTCALETTEVACKADAQRVEQSAEESGCEPQLQSYITCLEQAGCDFNSQCDGSRTTLEQCTGPFP